MNATELDISELVKRDDFDPYFLSNSVANLGHYAGRITWNNAIECTKRVPDLLATPELEQLFRDFVAESGGWTEDEINAWGHDELHALLLQWIAGDIREAFEDTAFEDWDWVQYEVDAEHGRVSSRIFKAADGRVFFSID